MFVLTVQTILLPLLFLTSSTAISISSSISKGNISRSKLSMGWSETWADIIGGGNPRWKVTDSRSHQDALSHFQAYVKTEPSEVSVLCPLAGDDPFIFLLWKCGYSVTTIDLVPDAVDALKEHFTTSDSTGAEVWTKEEKDGTIIYTHNSGRATLMVGDALQKRTHLTNTFDAVYDKDSFGALAKPLRSSFCKRISEYSKPGGIIYLECKLKDNHESVKDIGPPYSLTEMELMDSGNYGAEFEYVKGLGNVYNIGLAGMNQTGHILRKR